MSKQKKKGLVPELRFPEFQGAEGWSKDKLDNLATTIAPPKKLPTNLYKNAGQYPIIDQSQSEICGWTDDRESLISDHLPLIIFGDHTCALKIAREPFAQGADGIKILRAKERLVTEFLFQSLQYKPVVMEEYKRHFSILREKVVAFPCKESNEQQKIANFLFTIDELITLHTQKIDVLKAHKKGLMQQLFPAEGETVPKLRFPEFRKSGDWKKEPIGDRVELLSGYPFKSSEILEDSSGIPLMRGINITEGFIRHNLDIDRYYLGDIRDLKKYRLKTNDLVIGMDGSKVGKNSALITDRDTGSLLIQRVARLRSSCTAVIMFIFQHVNSSRFHSYVDRINTSSGIPHISAKQINEFEIYFPQDVKEQQKVAECLTEIDVIIAEYVQKVDLLKAHKKGLMQQLFPDMDEVSQ